MFSFLVEATKAGRVSEVFGSEPETAAPALNGSLYEIFADDDRDALQQAIRRCAGGGGFISLQSLRLKDPKPDLTVCLAPAEKRVLIFAAEIRTSKLGAQGRDLLNIVRLFMLAFNAHSRHATAGMQTDMIQTLAKELISRKRQMEETNVWMNLVNEDLNNRLVKDALTGLVSRYQYRAEIEYRIGGNPRKLGVFIFIDVDDFKSVNDRYGHAAGDEYLVELAERLKRLDIPDIVRMRISGDEFGLFVYGLDTVAYSTGRSTTGRGCDQRYPLRQAPSPPSLGRLGGRSGFGSISNTSIGYGCSSTTGMRFPQSFSISASSFFSSKSHNEMASPLRPARPVRPMRCT
jgi:GGDEF domain-containing protein